MQIRQLTDDNNLLKRDWAVLQGFRRGVSENFCGALDLEFHSALEHADYGYINVLPREYIDHLEADHCPMDVSVIDDMKENYYRGKGMDERLSKFATRPDEEQNSLAVDGVIIPDPDKFQHYLSEIYKSGIFTMEAITQWTEKTPHSRRMQMRAPSLRPNKEEWKRCSESQGGGHRWRGLRHRGSSKRNWRTARNN